MAKQFGSKLLEWHDPAARDLPWKKTRDPYKIWLSEVILQQTRVEQGRPYYLAFTRSFPNVKSLADAPQEAVLKLWEGLGYYSRARNLQVAARQILEQHRGRFPRDYGSIRALKGIGDYTAAAIASFAFGLPYAVVDGNVYRVLARVFGVELPINSPAGKRHFAELAQSLLDTRRPGAYNQALMDLGALVCTPRNPDCGNCPFGSDCRASREGRTGELPVKLGAAPKVTRYFHYFVITDGKRVLIRQRSDRDIWQGLHEFCLQESARPRAVIPGFLAGRLKKLPSPLSFRQVLSHRVVEARFYEIRVERLKDISLTGYSAAPWSNLGEYAFPKIIRQYLEERFKSLS